MSATQCKIIGMEKRRTQLIKISTAAGLIGVTRQTIYKHLNLGHLNLIEIDGVKFVNRDDVLVLDDKNRDMRERRRADKGGNKKVTA